MKYQWSRSPAGDRSQNVLHVSERLQYSSGSGGSPDFSPGLPEDEDREFIEDLWKITGVTTVYTHDYECAIVKARLFDWADMRPKVIEIFRRRFGDMEEVPGGDPVDDVVMSRTRGVADA